MWRAGYRLLLWLAFPFVLARLWWRGRHEPGYRQNIGERFGFYRAKPERRVILLHAVSVGVTRAGKPLLKALRFLNPDWHMLVTHINPTDPEKTRARFCGRVDISWLPSHS